MKQKLVIGFLLIVLFTATVTYAKEVSFTQEDRDRLIRLEEGQKALQKQIDDLKTFMLWGFGILFGGMGILIGFVIWDRRTALQPAMRKNKELEERQDKVEKALKEIARTDSKVAEILRNIGLM